jgi:erythromycin esterase
MSYSKASILAAFVLLLSHSICYAQKLDADIVIALNSLIRPVETLDPDASFSDLNFLKEVVSTKNVIGLGEVTHGTAEVFAYKDRLIRYLVTNHNFKAIGFESDFIAVEHFDNYINHVADTIKFAGGFPLNQYTRNMLSWLRTYNSEKAESDRVHLYGLEARGFYNISLKLLDAAPDLFDGGKQILNRFATVDYYSITKKDVGQLRALIPVLRTEQRLKSVSEAVFSHYIDILSDALDHHTKTSRGGRDEAMAKNAGWIVERTQNRKLIVWAHNGHVAKAPLFGVKKMGRYLAEKHDYYVIATDFSEGAALVTVQDQGRRRLSPVNYPKPDSPKIYEYYFEKLKYENFFLDISASRDLPAAKALFERPLNMHMIGGTPRPAYVKLALDRHFDLIIFIKRTTAS